MFRQAWTWLQKWHEPAIVGAAVALFGLAYLFPLATEIAQRSAQLAAPTTDQPTAYALGLYDVPRDDEFYRNQWIAEAKAFYAANPPKTGDSETAASVVIPASMRTSVQPTLNEQPVANESNVTQASHSDPQPNRTPETQASKPQPATGQTVLALPAKAQRWRVITCLAGGLLASLAFASIWPVNPHHQSDLIASESQMEVSGRAESIPIRIPATWVGLRPTWGQTARRGVLSGSYLVAALGAWGVVF